MPAPSRITPALVCEVSTRRGRGEPWKVIAADLRRRSLPAGRQTWWRRLGVTCPDVAEHRRACVSGASAGSTA